MAKYYNIAEKTFFVFPLRIGGYAMGFLLKAYNGSGYSEFYPLIFHNLPTLDDCKKIFENAPTSYPKRHTMLGFKEGNGWQVIGQVEIDKELVFPLKFKAFDILLKAHRIVYYDEKLKEIKREYTYDENIIKDLPDDGLAGHGFIEIKVTKLIEALSQK
jgi:hypothetical protein